MMRNPKKRYETSLGIAFDEAGDLQRLGDWAAEGWRLTGFRGLKYVLEPAPAEQVVFAVDYLYERTAGAAHADTWCASRLWKTLQGCPGPL